MTVGSASEEFRLCLPRALTCLYDPAVLASSPLVDLLVPKGKRDAAPALQAILLDAIESLRPGQGVPVGSREWRVFRILRARYTEQLTQALVGGNLGLSRRQMQREEAMARDVLADHLWTVHDLAASTDALSAASPLAPRHVHAAGDMPSQDEELAFVASSIPVKPTDVNAVLRDALTTISPLAGISRVSLAFTPQPDLPHMPLKAPLLRQAMVSILSMAVTAADGGKVRVKSQVRESQLRILIDAVASNVSAHPVPHGEADIDLARQLLALCGGTLQMAVPTDALSEVPSERVLVRVAAAFPTADEVPVLIIDDNGDTLHLLERYLLGSRYRFVGAQDARHSLDVAIDVQPRVVLLDVMMPEEDGWTLLGALREHPQTRDIPVIVCTIMAQKELALALGASEFMRKPVSQADLLAALDRQVAQPPAESRSGT